MGSMHLRGRYKDIGSGLAGVALLTFSACGQNMTADPASDDVTATSSALRCKATSTDPGGCVWKAVGPFLPGNVAPDPITHTQSPALCGTSTPSAAAVFSVDSKTGQFVALQYNVNAPATAWSNYGFMSFSSPPTCTFRELDQGGNAGIVVAGKSATSSTAGGIFASAGTMAPNGYPQGNPTTSTPFTQISSATYPLNSFAGNPALASNASNRIVLTFMSGPNLPNTVYAHTHDIPYLGASWSSVITGPALPTGWNAQGAPAIVWKPSVSLFYIVVHGRNGSGTDALFVTYFNPSGNFFSNSSGTASLGWSPSGGISVGHIDGAPSVEYAPALGATTIYFLNGSRMMQVSAPYTAAPLVVKQTGMTAPAFASGTSPSASGGWATDGNAGTHNVVGRVGTGIYLGVANSDSLIGP